MVVIRYQQWLLAVIKKIIISMMDGYTFLQTKPRQMSLQQDFKV